jgi:serine/threonine protein kinase
MLPPRPTPRKKAEAGLAERELADREEGAPPLAPCVRCGARGSYGKLGFVHGCTCSREVRHSEPAEEWSHVREGAPVRTVIERVPGVVISARYQLVRQLGFGGMGTVWLAQDLLLDSKCALKLIDDDKARSEEVRMRFAREAKVAAQLRGSHVVDVFEHGEWEGIPFIAMEYLEGEDLGSRLDRLGKLDAATTYRIVAHVSRALARAHACGIVHRDLKPENVFLIPGDDGEIAKVVDFGIAKHDAYSLRDKATKTGSFLGTPYYVSPEQARGKPTDHRSDLWSLGVIAFQCLTGTPPFESEALGELMGLILYEDLPMPSERDPSLPPALDAWWQRAAARERDLRFQSAKELADALAAALALPATVSVPSLPPGRNSIVDLETPIPIHPRAPFSSSSDLILFGTTPSEEQRVSDTGAPLSLTRHSAIPVVTRLRSALRAHANPREWPRAVRAAPRRKLIGASVIGAITLGALVTFVVSGGEPAPTNSVAPRTPAAPPVAPPEPEVRAVGPATPPTAPAPVPSPSVVAKPVESKPAQSAASAAAKRPAAPVRNPTPAPKKNTKRDYGI